MDRVTFELNQHLNEEEDALAQEELEELEIFQDRMLAVIRIMSMEENVKVKAARLVSFIEGEVSEYS
tara:strand:- start:248 stop:448 length:201 start_codon:yes stop_codon:yes gene_type:complete